MADSVLRIKSKEFAKDIVFLCRNLKHNGVESALINQLLRCGTSVGANVHEAQYAQGTKDFISKFEGDVPGVSAIECGNYRDHDLEGAKKEAAAQAEVLKDWTTADMIY